MKRVGIVLVMVGLGIFSLKAQSTPARHEAKPQEETGPFVFPFIGEVTSRTAHVRAGLGIAYERLTTLRKGERIVVYEEKNGWYRIAPPAGVHFYVAGRDRRETYVRKIEGSENPGVVLVDRLNVRAAARLRSTVVSQLMAGNTIQIADEKPAEDKEGQTAGVVFYEIAPPEHTFCWISQSLVHFTSAYTRELAQNLSQASSRKLSVSEWLDQYRQLQEKEAKAKSSASPDLSSQAALGQEFEKLAQGAPSNDLKKMALQQSKKLQKGTTPTVQKTQAPHPKTFPETLPGGKSVASSNKETVEKAPTAPPGTPTEEENKFKEETFPASRSKGSGEVTLEGYLEELGYYVGRPAPFVLKGPAGGQSTLLYVDTRDSNIQLRFYTTGGLVSLTGSVERDSKGRKILYVASIERK